MSSQNEAGLSEHRKSDSGWKYNYLVDPKDKNSITCKFCKKVTNGGIYRAKAHQIRGNRNVKERKFKQAYMMLVIRRLEAEQYKLLPHVFYQARITFNVANMDCFKEMITAVGSYGPHLKPPSYQELRVPLLRNEVQSVQQWVEGHNSRWSKFGCSIMLDGWTDRRQRTLINFHVNSPKGTVFLESVDASSYTKIGDKVFELLDNFVQRVGEENVMQIITDNGSNFKAACKKLTTKRPNLFWTPCAAHCLDLMLEDIGKIDIVKKTIQKGIFLVGYIYNHTVVLNITREFTNNNELTKAGVTRFATTFLTLKSLHKQKSDLRNMFASEKWSNGKWAEEQKGKRANDIVFTPGFWINVNFILKVMGPLVQVLRIVDNEKKPAMGYGAME
ncbi:uncharacterized protein LOC110932064 [Helianthus annuus]|uniref:uncharacterized protein LOC110932064 n=1 Tax=Helianthus annuus TaxID=4232 RepID=UPI000B9072BE|nr:uncharacterized protein LOC110932064 [Helianthus annuus]